MINVDQPFRPCIFCNKPAFGDGSEYAGEHGRYYHRRCLVRAEDEARYPQTVGNYVPYLDPVHHMDLVQEMNEKARLEQQLISFDDLKKELEQRKEKEEQLSSKLGEQELILAEQRTELEKLNEESEDEIKKRNHTIEQLEAKNEQLRAVVSERESKVGDDVLGRDQQPVSSDNLKKELEQRKDKEKQTELTTGSIANQDEETWTIWVELSRITFPLHVKPSNTIRDVMVMIEKKECIAVRDQRLFPAGRQLKEQSYTLAAYGLTDNSVIDLLVI